VQEHWADLVVLACVIILVKQVLVAEADMPNVTLFVYVGAELITAVIR